MSGPVAELPPNLPVPVDDGACDELPGKRFPELGRALTGRWTGFRVVLGPWSWMLLVYVFEPATGLVTVVAIQDSREATSATSAG